MIMKTLKTLSTALMLLTMLIGFNTQSNAQSNRYGGTAYVYAEDNRGKEIVLNATTEYLYSSESEARSALSKELKKWNHYQHASDIRYSIERWDSDKRYEGYASATVIDNRGNEKKISISIDCDAVGLGYITYFRTLLKSRLDREKSNSYDYISPISYRVNSCN